MRINCAFFFISKRKKLKNMKNKFWIIVVLILFVLAVALFLPENKEYDYLRLHIRANSNSAIDQNVKYEIKDELVSFLTPYFCSITSKEDAIELTRTLTEKMEQICTDILSKKGFSYSVNIKIDNEYFPTRTYSNTTLESGYYDAVIVELGQAEGDNWWCVMYPPLCFVNNFENSIQIKYKSKIVEWFKNLFD